MKPTRKDGGPAFPLGDMEWNEANAHNNGMTLRDYFAGQALAGILVNAKACHQSAIPELAKTSAKISFLVADAMLADRNNQSNKTK